MPTSHEDAPPGRAEPLKVADSHFVLKSPMYGPWPGTERVVFGTGCFWGAEKGFWRFPGVVTTAVGYTAGVTPNPTYKEVCTGKTGHNEVVQVVFDPTKVTFVDIVRQFLQCHDPTQGFRQGADSGTQYRSGLYYTTEDQKRIGEKAFEAYEKALGKKITAELIPAPEFYYAEDYHQQYLAKPGNRPYCSAEPTGTTIPDYKTWCPKDLCDKYAPKLPEAYWNEHAPTPHCVLRLPNEPVEWQ